jgi:hypothetical protein
MTRIAFTLFLLLALAGLAILTTTGCATAPSDGGGIGDGDSSDVIGTWTAIKVTVDGVPTAHVPSIVLNFEADGTGTTTSDGKSQEMSWRRLGGQVTVTVGGDNVAYVLEDQSLVETRSEGPEPTPVLVRLIFRKS